VSSETKAGCSPSSIPSRIPADHPLRQGRALVRVSAASAGFIHTEAGRARAVVERHAAAGVLRPAAGAAADGATRLQPAVPRFVGLSPDDRVWDATSFTKSREHLEQGQVFDKFMAKLLEQPEVNPLPSDEHVSVDGTLIEAWASNKSFKP
jgi:hypothetical protein